jgi:hypothetical protein
MATYDYHQLTTPERSGHEWIDRKGNILKVPDASWDGAIDDDKGYKLQAYLQQEGYDGPGDWNPR